MLSVTNKPFTLSVFVLNVVMLSDVMLSVVAPLGPLGAVSGDPPQTLYYPERTRL
jgi:hypothetical protein